MSSILRIVSFMKLIFSRKWVLCVFSVCQTKRVHEAFDYSSLGEEVGSIFVDFEGNTKCVRDLSKSFDLEFFVELCKSLYNVVIVRTSNEDVINLESNNWSIIMMV